MHVLTGSGDRPGGYIERQVYLPGHFASNDFLHTTSMEASLGELFMWSQKTSNPHPGSQGLCIAADGALESKGESGAPAKYQTVKNSWDDIFSLGTGRTRRERCVDV